MTDGLQKIVKSIKPIFTTPWGPHISIEITIAASPRQVSGLVHCIPRALPIEEFRRSHEQLEPNQQQLKWEQAQAAAENKLAKQKQVTGVAILGKAPKALEEDPKFKDLLNSSIQSGEKLARSALSIEYLVLEGAGIPTKDWHKYIGRSQYPKF